MRTPSTALCRFAIRQTFIHGGRYLGQCYTDLPGICSINKVLIVHGEGDKMIFRVGDKCYDPQIYVK